MLLLFLFPFGRLFEFTRTYISLYPISIRILLMDIWTWALCVRLCLLEQQHILNDTITPSIFLAIGKTCFELEEKQQRWPNIESEKNGFMHFPLTLFQLMTFLILPHFHSLYSFSSLYWNSCIGRRIVWTSLCDFWIDDFLWSIFVKRAGKGINDIGKARK